MAVATVGKPLKSGVSRGGVRVGAAMAEAAAGKRKVWSPVSNMSEAVYATDEEVREASAWVMTKYKEAFQELARYDSN